VVLSGFVTMGVRMYAVPFREDTNRGESVRMYAVPFCEDTNRGAKMERMDLPRQGYRFAG